MKTTARLAISLSFLLATGAVAQSSWTVTSPSCVAPMGTIVVSIQANSGAANQSAAQYHVRWDPAIFMLDSSFGLGGYSFQSGWDGVANTMLPGDLYVSSWHLPVYPTGSSTLINLRLINLGGFGTFPISSEVEIWANSARAPITPTPFFATSSNVTIGCGPLPSCTITNPVTGQLIVGTHPVTFNLANPTAGPVNLTFEYNAGSGWMPCTPTGTSPLPNPATGVAPAMGLIFQWNMNVDFFLPDTDIDLRITVLDPVVPAGNNCLVNVDVDIVNNPPTCSITSPLPGGLVFGPTHMVTFDLADLDGNLVDITYEIDDGMGFTAASRVGGAPAVDVGVTPAAALNFNWDIAADFPTGATGVIFRISLNDNRPMGMGSCQVMFDVRPPNSVPTCNFIFPGAGATLMGTPTLLFSTADGDGDLIDLLFEVDPGSGFIPMTPTVASALPNPALDRMPSGANSFQWNLRADIPMSTLNVVVRITADDDFGGVGTCSRIYNVTVPQTPPTCAITAPAAGTAISSTQVITFNGLDVDMDPLDITFEYDAGAGFMAATATLASPLTSPALGVTPGSGLTFEWDALTDVGSATIGVTFRISVNDGRGGLTRCTRIFDITGTCALCGDCNSNGVIPQITDSLTAAQISVSIIVPTPTQVTCCDVDADTDIDIIDALFMAQDSAGIAVVLTCP